MTDKIRKILMGVAALAALALGGAALAGAASGGKDTAQPSREAAEKVGGSETSEPAESNAPENSATDTDNVQDENGKDDAGEASEKGENEGSDKPVTGEAASRAKAAAAAETGGKPGAVERDSEKGATYEVEVTKADGKKADVRLDDQYKVVGVDEDNEKEDAGEQSEAGEPAATTP